MSGGMDIHFSGLGLVSTTDKRLNRSTKYDHLFAKPNWKQIIVRKNGVVTDVVKDMKTVIYGYRDQTKEFAPYMRGINIYETCRNIWDFWYNRCAYKEDEKGLEQLRTAARSYWEGAGYEPGAKDNDFGIDCDDFAISVAQTLLNLGIPCYLRIARYPLVDYFQHVYVVVLYDKKEIIIDCVLDAFDMEKPPAEKQDFLIMDKHRLNGIDVAILSGVGDSSTPLLEVVTGSDFYGLSGSDQSDGLDALYQHIKKTRDLVAENPELVKEAEHPATFLKMLDYALQYWNTDKRDDALAILASRENEANELRGFSPGSDTSENEIEIHPLSGGGYQVLGKIGGQRKFFNKVKEAVKHPGKTIKEAAKAAVRYNPLTLAARGGVLLAMKTNLFHMAAHLKWGYLTQTEAQKIGLHMGEWAKAKDSLAKTEDMYVKILQGDKDTLRKEILTGRAGDLNTITLGSLGIEPVTTTASTAAASGFIAKIGSWIKGIDLKKMLKNVNVKKLAENIKQKISPGSESANTKESGSADTTTADNGSNNTRTPDEEDSGMSAALPLLVIGGLGLAMFMTGKKNKKESKSNGYSGFGSAKSKRKSKRKKKSDFDIYDYPAITGVNKAQGTFKPGDSHKKIKRKAAKKSRIKKMKLR